MIAGIWQGLLLTSAAWLLLEAFPKLASKVSPNLALGIPSRMRFTLWMIVFLLAALLPLASLPGIAPAVSSQGSGGLILASALELPSAWAAVLDILWALASLFAFARLLAGGYRLYRLRSTAQPLPAETLEVELRSMLARRGSRPVPLCLSGEIDSPVVIGFFRPAIVLPQWLQSKLSSSELKQIVIHELAHLERRDDWTNLLARCLCALFPLNPALLWAGCRLSKEREMACDDLVLEARISPRDYAACLASLAERRLLRHTHSLAPGAWRRRSELAERVHRILQRKNQLGNVRAGAPRALAATFLAACLCAGAALTRCPQLVTFISPSKDLSAASAVPGDRIPSELQHSSMAHFENAALQVKVPVIAPARKATRTPRYATFRDPASESMGHRLIQSQWAAAGFVPLQIAEGLHISQPSETANQPRIVFTVWEIPLPAIPESAPPPPQFAVFHSNSGWIVFQL